MAWPRGVGWVRKNVQDYQKLQFIEHRAVEVGGAPLLTVENAKFQEDINLDWLCERGSVCVSTPQRSEAEGKREACLVFVWIYVRRSRGAASELEPCIRDNPVHFSLQESKDWCLYALWL